MSIAVAAAIFYTIVSVPGTLTGESKMLKTKLGAYDVDTQDDFMRSTGALPVPNAEQITPNLEKLTNYFSNTSGIVRFKSKDRHFGTEEWKPYEGELAKWAGLFPMHCESGTNGQENIPETAVEEIIIENTSPIQEIRQYTSTELDAIINSREAITFEKQSYSVFPTDDCPGGNKYAEQIIEHSGVTDFIVYGVATNICVEAAVMGLLDSGKNVHLVTDAIQGIDIQPGDVDTSLQKMYAAGAKPITTQEVLEGKLAGNI